MKTNLKLKLKLQFILLSFLIFTSTAKAAEVVVLVPGFFNSFAPQYFSSEIVATFARRGFKVYIAGTLDPLGTIETNGARLESVFAKIESTEGHRVRFNVVAHSAGGLYSLWAANNQKYDIKKLLTISTPYLGIDFIQAWMDDCSVFNALSKLAYLEGFRQLTRSGVATFLSTIRVSPMMKIIAFAGYQNESIDITDARNISWPLRITSQFIPGKSDGIVSYKSALGLGTIKTTDATKAAQFVVNNVVLNLEHWEQVVDSQAFVFLGIRNTSYIAAEQKRFYESLATLINEP